MLVQRQDSSEIYDKCEYEALLDVDSDTNHPARFKNIYVWISWTWYTSQQNPYLEPMDVQVPSE